MFEINFNEWLKAIVFFKDMEKVYFILRYLLM